MVSPLQELTRLGNILGWIVFFKRLSWKCLRAKTAQYVENVITRLSK